VTKKKNTLINKKPRPSTWEKKKREDGFLKGRGYHQRKVCIHPEAEKERGEKVTFELCVQRKSL